MHTRKRWTWKNLRLDSDLGESLGLQFQLDIFHAALDVEPENIDLLLDLGNLYTRLGYLREGLQIDERLVEIRPEEPVFHYNLACSLSRLDERTRAFRALKRAIELGYDNLEFIEKDPDLANLRSDDRYPALLKSITSGNRSDVGARPAPRDKSKEVDVPENTAE